MPSAQTDALFVLIKSLTKAEKRSFKLYANRNQNSGDLKFIQLFDVLDKMATYDDALIAEKMNKLKGTRLSNLKRHLYKQILISLRLIHIQKNIDIQIREQIDFAKILYGKGLYLQSLKLLDRILPIANDHHQDLLSLEILEFQKLIEERHITRSRQVKGKVEDLIKAATNRSQIIDNACRLSNLKIKIHGWYIQIGHAKNDKDRIMVQEYFHSNLPKVKPDDLTFFERVYLHQSYVWYYYILLDFASCFEHARQWTEMFDATEALKEEDPDLYMRGLHYVLTSLYNMGETERFAHYLSVFNTFEKQAAASFSTISKTIAFLYGDTARINQHYLKGTFKEGVPLVKTIIKKIKQYEIHLDQHRIMVFNYKIAYLYFGAGHYDEALDYLNRIINLKAGHLREDIQSYARILHLLCHFELSHYELLEYLVASVHRFLQKFEELNQVQRETLNFIKQFIRMPLVKDKTLLIKFQNRLSEIADDPYERRALLNLDVLSWAECKIEDISLSEKIQQKLQEKN
ncbi:MAG: hypothetical protein AAFP19_25385 [Bacteroidota bacterium]